MVTTQPSLRKRLAYILHLGFVEVRNLAGLSGYEQQIHDLADAMETLPRFMDAANAEDLEAVRFALRDYQERYASKFDYLSYVDQQEPPEVY